MNILLDLFERTLIGPQPESADEILLDFQQDRTLSRKAFTEGILTMASIGRGKTTLLKTPARAMLRDGFGGLIPIVKGSLVDDMLACIKAERRDADLVVFGPERGHVFNPFESMTQPAEAAALLAELSAVLSNQRGDGANEQFWSEQLAIILRHLFALCLVQHGRMDVIAVNELFAGRANTAAELSDPNWQQTSPMHRAMETALRSTGCEAGDAVTYFRKTYVNHGDRLQGSLAATVSVVFDHLCRAPLRNLFTGESTFTLDGLLDDGKICLVAMPVLDSTAGRVANALLQFCFCREAVRHARSHYSFLILDECQELVTTELMAKMALLRESKVSVLLLTQNLAVLDERLGETTREGLFGLMGTKIFGPQTHAATRQWAAEEFGKRKFENKSSTRGSSSHVRGSTRSKTVADQWDYRVPPHRFAGLNLGETLVLRNDEIWPVRWHKDKPGKNGTVRIV